MQGSVSGCSFPRTVTIDYQLLAALNRPRADEEGEPIAVCTVRLERGGALWEEYPLAAWHFPPGRHPVVMPIEETGDSTDEQYTGRFLLLPSRDLTLATVGERGARRPFVQLRLAPTGNPGGGEGGICAWRVFVVWSEGGEVSLHRGSSSPFLSSVRALHLSDAQCCAFVRLGGMLHAGRGSAHWPVTMRNLTCVSDAEGRVGYALLTCAEPGEGGPISTCSISRSFRVAIELGDITLSECWLLLPVLCQGCQQPIIGEVVYMETLWGRMHPGCAETSSHQACDADLIATEPERERTGAVPYQLVLPGMK